MSSGVVEVNALEGSVEVKAEECTLAVTMELVGDLDNSGFERVGPPRRLRKAWRADDLCNQLRIDSMRHGQRNTDFLFQFRGITVLFMWSLALGDGAGRDRGSTEWNVALGNRTG